MPSTAWTSSALAAFPVESVVVDHVYSIDYSRSLFVVKLLPGFAAWLVAIRDPRTRVRLARRLDKAGRGLLGDVKPVGHGVHEMREDFGPGWRMYYVHRGGTLIVMLGGGDKSTQKSDIARAVELAAALED